MGNAGRIIGWGLRLLVRPDRAAGEAASLAIRPAWFLALFLAEGIAAWAPEARGAEPADWLMASLGTVAAALLQYFVVYRAFDGIAIFLGGPSRFPALLTLHAALALPGGLFALLPGLGGILPKGGAGIAVALAAGALNLWMVVVSVYATARIYGFSAPRTVLLYLLGSVLLVSVPVMEVAIAAFLLG